MEVITEFDAYNLSIYEQFLIHALNMYELPADEEEIVEIVSILLDVEPEAIAAEVMSAIDGLVGRGAIAIEEGFFKLTSMGHSMFEMLVN